MAWIADSLRSRLNNTVEWMSNNSDYIITAHLTASCAGIVIGCIVKMSPPIQATVLAVSSVSICADIVLCILRSGPEIPVEGNEMHPYHFMRV